MFVPWLGIWCAGVLTATQLSTEWQLDHRGVGEQTVSGYHRPTLSAWLDIRE